MKNHCVSAKWLSGGVFARMSAGFCWLFKCGCAGGEIRCVDFGNTKRGQEINCKSTVQERSHANNARLLCLACLKTSLASQEHAYTAFLFFLSVDANSIECL